MAEYLIRLTAPLDEPHVTRIWSGELVYGSKQADRVIVTATSGGEKVTLTGTVTAKLLKADGNTLTWTGVLDDGEAQVLLPANAYDVEGAAILNIFADNGDVRTPLAVMRLMVSKSVSASEIVPAGSVPDLQSLLSEITAMEAATVNANAASANANESAEAYNAILTELDGTVYTQYLRDANMTTGEYYTLSDGAVTTTESSAQKLWEPIELPAGTYTYVRIVGYYSYVDNGTTITKLRDTTGTNSSPITVTFATPVTVYISASTTSAGNNAMLCNGSSVPESYVEGAYSAELARVDELDADVSDLKSAIGDLEVPALPSADGNYTLRLTVSGGTAAYSWAAE